MKRMHKELEQRDQEQALAARRRRRAKRSKGVSVQGFLARVAVFYFLIAYFLVCPSDTSRERAVCRGLDTVHSTLAAYEPRVRPYLTTAHRKLDPYISLAQSRAQPYVKQVQPYYTRADSFVRPYASQSISFYRTSIRPHLEHAVALTRQTTRPILARLGKQYQHTLAPSVEWYSRAGSSYYAKNLKPHFDVASNSARQVGTKAYDVVAPVYHTGLPLAKKHYYASVLPWTKKTSAATQKTYYRVVHPQVLTVGKHGIRLYQTRILPTWQRFYSLFVAPQLDKISERIFEYRAKKSEVEATKKVKEVEQKIVADNDADDFEGECGN